MVGVSFLSLTLLQNHSKPLGRMGEGTGTLPRWKTVCALHNLFLVVTHTHTGYTHTGCLGMIPHVHRGL